MTNTGAVTLSEFSINESMLADACQLYAEEMPIDERDEFIDHFLSDETKLALLKKAVLDALVVACFIESSDSLESFKEQISEYGKETDMDESNHVILEMKTKMLEKLTDDSIACDQCSSSNQVVAQMVKISIEHFEGAR